MINQITMYGINMRKLSGILYCEETKKFLSLKITQTFLPDDLKEEISYGNTLADILGEIDSVRFIL